MRPSLLLWQAFIFLIYPSVIFTLCLYLYPALFGCSFPAPSRKEEASCLVDGDARRNVTIETVAPFRLLVFADPQLEGDSSLPNTGDPTFPSIQRFWAGASSDDAGETPYSLVAATSDAVTKDIPHLLWSYRKRLDLLGNDFYLAHIHRTLHWWLNPTHMTVLGDLIGSQWVTDDEFSRRGHRFWNRVFRGAHPVENHKTMGWHEQLAHSDGWNRRLIAIPGNHDIGYAGDLTRNRIDRFERVFGRANWDARFQLPPRPASNTGGGPLDAPPTVESTPELRLVMLNSMNLDGPVLDAEVQKETYSFMNDRLIKMARPVSDRTAATIILTHIPLHKHAGLCTDPPYIDYSPAGIREQNHLSEFSSRSILEGILGMGNSTNDASRGKGRKAIILAGHDHEGCDVLHYTKANAVTGVIGEWAAERWAVSDHLRENRNVAGVREVTVRSMMGSYGGNAGMLSAWFDDEAGEWAFEYDACELGVQHLWWGVHVLDLVTVCVLLAAGLAAAGEEVSRRRFVRQRIALLRRPTVDLLYNKKEI